MKNRSHTCGTWYDLLHSPRKFRLSKMQWGNLFNRSKPEKSREQGALWLKCQNHKFDHFYQCQLLGLIRILLCSNQYRPNTHLSRFTKRQFVSAFSVLVPRLPQLDSRGQYRDTFTVCASFS